MQLGAEGSDCEVDDPNSSDEEDVDGDSDVLKIKKKKISPKTLHYSDEEDDDGDAEFSKIKKKKISASTLQYSVEDDNGDDFQIKKIKKKKTSASALHHSDEREDGGVEIKKRKKKKTSASGSHHSGEKTHKRERPEETALKKDRPVARHSDQKKEEKDKIKEALQKRCVVKIEKQAAILERREAVAAGEGPGEVRCVYCSRTFKTVGGMKVHRTRIHFQKEGNAPWCVSCQQLFRDVKKLNQHSKRCAGIRKDVPSTGDQLALQRTPAGFLVPSPGQVLHSTPRDKQLAFEVFDKLHQGALPAPPVTVPKYQFPSRAPTGVSPARVTAAVKEKHIGSGSEGAEVKVESPARSPRRKSLRPKKVVKVADEPGGDNAEWEGANASFWQDGERRVQPSRSAKSAVESYCECSNKSGPEDSQDGDTEKAPAEGSGTHEATSDRDAAQLGDPARGGQRTPVASGAKTSTRPSTAKKWQHQTEGEGRGVVAIDIRHKKKETVKSRQTLLVRPNRPSLSSAGVVRRESVAGSQMKSRAPQAAPTVGGSDGPNWDDARLLVQKNCLPVTEMVRMSMIPSVRRDESDRQEVAALYGGNLVTVGLHTHYYFGANEQSQSRHVSHLNTDTNYSGNKTKPLFENPCIEDGEQQSPLNSTAEMNSLEEEDHNNPTDRTNPSYICQKPSPLRIVKGDTGTVLEINMDAPLNLSTNTSAEEATNYVPSNLNEMGATQHTEEDNSELCDKSDTRPQNGNSPQCSDVQQVDGHPYNASHDVIQSGQDVHEKGGAPTKSVQDAAMDLRKILGKSPTVPGGSEEVANFVLATSSSNCPSSDLGEGPSTSMVKFKAAETCDATEVEADERPAREDIYEPDVAGSTARSPSQFSESEDLTALDSVRTVAASADDEASDGSDTETCDGPPQAWSPDHQSENGDRRSVTLYSNGPVSSTSITAIYNDSSSRSEMCESRHHSPQISSTAELEASRRQSSPSRRRIASNTSMLSHVDQSVIFHTADSTTGDPLLEESNMTHPLSLTPSPQNATSQSRLVGRNIVEDVEIQEVNGENLNNTLEERKPSKLSASSDIRSAAHYSPNDSKLNYDTDRKNESQETTLRGIETLKKVIETIPEAPKSPARERVTETEDQKACNSGDSSEAAEPPTHSQELAPFFLAPGTMTASRALSPRTITVPKDLSEYESSNCSTTAEEILKARDLTPNSVEVEEGSSGNISCTDLHGEELSQSLLIDRGSVLRNGGVKTGFPVSGESSPSRTTVDTVTNCAARSQSVIVGTDLRGKVGKGAGTVRSGVTGDSWLHATPLPYCIQRVLCSSPKSPASPVSPLPAYVGRSISSPRSPLAAFKCLRSPQSDSGSKSLPPSPTGERQSPARPPPDEVGMSEAKLPPFATLAKSLAETERPNRPCSLPAGVKLELTKGKQNDDETQQMDSVPAQCVNATLSEGTGNKQRDIQSKPCSKLPECPSPKDDELYILYEHRPKAINLSLQDRPSSAPLAQSDKKGEPNTDSFPPRSDFESHEKGTLTTHSDADQCVHQKETTPQGFLGSGALHGPLAAAVHPYSQQSQPTLEGGSPSNAALKSPSHSAPQHTQYKGDSPHQGVTQVSWPVFETGQAYQLNQNGNVPTTQGAIVQGTVTNALSDTTNSTCRNAPQAGGKNISSVAGGAFTMSHSTWGATNQNTAAQGGQRTLPNLPDIIGCRMAASVAGKPTDTVGNEQTERGSSGIPADGWTVKRAGSGRRGRGGRRGLPGRDDLQPCDCPCGKVCKNYRGLEQHKARAHRDVVFFKGDGGESCSSWPHVLGARSFRCPCGARFVRLDAIKKHFAAEQAESGGRRWWISDRVPICTCRHAVRGSGAHDYTAPQQSSGYLQNNCGAAPASGQVYPQQTWPGTTLQHQSTPGQAKQSWPSALETHGIPTTDARLLQNLSTASYGGVPGQYASNNNPASLWAPPFPVSGPPSRSVTSVLKPAHTTGQHSTNQKSTSDWWSPGVDAQKSVTQLSSSVQMLSSMPDSSNVARNPVEHYNFSSDATREFQHTVPTLSARPQEVTVTRTGANTERLQQFATGAVGGWTQGYGSQSTDGSWAIPMTPLSGGTALSIQQQHNKTSSNQGYQHMPQLGLPDPTASCQGQQNTNLDTPTLGNVVGDSRPEPQPWNFQLSRSSGLISSAQPRPKPQVPFTLQEFCSPQHNVAPFQWGPGMLTTPPAAHSGPVASSTGGRPSQSWEQTEYSGAGTGRELTQQLAHTQTSGAQGYYPSGVCTGPAFQANGEQPVGVADDGGGPTAPPDVGLMAAMKNNPKWKLLPDSKTRED